MTTYNIYITNNSYGIQTYFLFCELPTIENLPSDKTPYSNVYASGRPRQNDGSIQQFSVTSDAFACCGYSQIKKNVIIAGSDNTPVSLDGTDVNTANMVVIDGGPGFVTTTTGADAGSFDINVGPYDKSTWTDVWCGYGKLSALGDTAPNLSATVGTAVSGVKVAACWSADPGVTYIVQPVVKFYVATGSYSPGQVVNLTEIGAKVLIDFTKQGNKVHASVTMGSDGTYSQPTYSAQPPAALTAPPKPAVKHGKHGSHHHREVTAY